MFGLAQLLKGFGPTTGAGDPPATPLIEVTDNGDGTATVTITGSTASSFNTVFYQSASSSVWSSGGNRTSDGDVNLTLDPGRYFIYVSSLLNDQITPSAILVFYMSGAGDGELTHSPADIVRYLLIAHGQGTLPVAGSAASWQIWADGEPSTPDSSVTVYNTSGTLDGRSQINGEMFEHYGVQIRVRSVRPDTGWTKIKQIVSVVDEQIYRDTVVIASSEYLVQTITRKGGVLALGKETSVSKRNLFTVNAVVSLRQEN